MSNYDMNLRIIEINRKIKIGKVVVALPIFFTILGYKVGRRRCPIISNRM